MRITRLMNPVAIAMWDFSWIERRWDGAGYADWDRALDELAERGYDAVRIDAYPHFFASDPREFRTVLPIWDRNDWGSPGKIPIAVQPGLPDFVGKCRARGIGVGLSSWYRDDASKCREDITNPGLLAHLWSRVLDALADAGLLDSVLFVDLCNEWPDGTWAPFYRGEGSGDADWSTGESLRWMAESIGRLRERYPDTDYTFSFASHLFDRRDADLSMADFLELHTWMTRDSDFYDRIGYDYPKFERYGYDIVVDRAEALYRADPDHWRRILVANIRSLARWSEESRKPLVSTECWGIVDYKDWPGLDWGWVKELAAIGVETAVETRRWNGIATSNFCGPQFRGMWCDVDWHRRLTDAIKKGAAVAS